jgi:hypothetical protein
MLSFGCKEEARAYLELWADCENREILLITGWESQFVAEETDRDCARWNVEG